MHCVGVDGPGADLRVGHCRGHAGGHVVPLGAGVKKRPLSPSATEFHRPSDGTINQCCSPVPDLPLLGGRLWTARDGGRDRATGRCSPSGPLSAARPRQSVSPDRSAQRWSVCSEAFVFSPLQGGGGDRVPSFWVSANR